MDKCIYFDNAATTKAYSENVSIIEKYMTENYANPSSMHKMGFLASKIQNEASKELLSLLGINEERHVIFTSGATEATNLAIKGTLERSNKKFALVTTTIEHPATANVARFYEQKGYPVTFVPVDKKNGYIDEEYLQKSINEDTRIFSMIVTHNEIGVVQDFEKIAALVKKLNPNTLVHLDVVQWIGRGKSAFKDVDMLSMSAHKIHGIKGIGALVVKKNIPLVAQILGGNQQDGLRSGTIPTPLIASLAKTCQIANETFEERNKKEKEVRDYFYEKIKSTFGEDVIVNTPIHTSNISSHIMNISFASLKGEVLLHMLENDGIYVSTSSACSSNKAQENSVLNQFGILMDGIIGALRFSFSHYNTKQEVDYAVEKLSSAVYRLKKIGGNLYK